MLFYHFANFIYVLFSVFLSFSLPTFSLLFVFEAGTLTKFAVNRDTGKKKEEVITIKKKEKNRRELNDARAHIDRFKRRKEETLN